MCSNFLKYFFMFTNSNETLLAWLKWIYSSRKLLRFSACLTLDNSFSFFRPKRFTLVCSPKIRNKPFEAVNKAEKEGENFSIINESGKKSLATRDEENNVVNL